ncbi:MAG: anthranilate synthase component I [Lachnospiraceae bacterium]|nr:anthranilate synthase component I [Lachnospiraceae bacterium]
MDISVTEVKEIAKSGDYKRIPVWKELYADAFTPVEVMRRLRAASRHVFLLESASQAESWGRYSFLGYDPTMEITCTDGLLRIRRTTEECSPAGGNGADQPDDTDEKQTAHPGEELRRILADYRSPVIAELPPFTGGLVGYFSYDYIKYAEPKLRLETEKGEFNDVDLMLFDEVIAFDHYKQKVYLIAGVKTDDIEASYQKAQERIARTEAIITSNEKMKFQPLALESEVAPQFSEEEYTSMVEKAKHYIREGDIFQVVLSNPMRAKASGNLFDTYRTLRVSNPSPYMFYFASSDIEMAGASPETLVKLVDGRLSTFPLAGTRPRGKNRREDEALEQELLSDEKELAEHNMLVDLGRNDMGRISKVGTVEVEDYLSIQRFSQVMHIGSTVVGEIREDKDAIDAVDAILPAGTLSGAPKFRACQIIEELEQSRRGVYGGAIGYIDFTGNLDVCIAIRLVYKKDGEICIRSGAGIVADSDPAKEFVECQNKAKAVVKALGGLE